MATTTNYGWTTPDDTALVKDGAAAIRTLGSSVDTTTKALNPSTTLGDIEYRSSTANTNTRLPIGTTGQILTVAGGVPSWANSATGSWTTWTPTIGGLTQGNGTLTARYIQNDKIVDFFIAFTFGTTSSISGLNFTLPVSSSQNIFTIYGVADDVGTVGYPIFAQVESNTAYARAINTSGTYASATSVTGSVPFSWGNTDRFNFSGSYEVA